MLDDMLRGATPLASTATGVPAWSTPAISLEGRSPSLIQECPEAAPSTSGYSANRTSNNLNHNNPSATVAAFSSAPHTASNITHTPSHHYSGMLDIDPNVFGYEEDHQQGGGAGVLGLASSDVNTIASSASPMQYSTPSSTFSLQTVTLPETISQSQDGNANTFTTPRIRLRLVSGVQPDPPLHSTSLPRSPTPLSEGIPLSSLLPSFFSGLPSTRIEHDENEEDELISGNDSDGSEFRLPDVKKVWIPISWPLHLKHL